MASMRKRILFFTLALATSGLAAAQTDWFVGTDSRIQCDGDGEADGIIFAMADAGGGRDDFQNSMKKSGERLSTKLTNLLTKKAVSGTTFPEETDHYVLKAVCITKVVSEGKAADGFDERFRKTLEVVEARISENEKTMPSTQDAVTQSEKASAHVNDVFFANRGAISFVLTMFKVQEEPAKAGKAGRPR